MLPICVRPERVWPKLSSIQGIRSNLVYLVSLPGRKSDGQACKKTQTQNMFRPVIWSHSSTQVHRYIFPTINEYYVSAIFLTISVYYTT